jgi:hypothetical protein
MLARGVPNEEFESTNVDRLQANPSLAVKKKEVET